MIGLDGKQRSDSSHHLHEIIGCGLDAAGIRQQLPLVATAAVQWTPDNTFGPRTAICAVLERFLTSIARSTLPFDCGVESEVANVFLSRCL